MLAIKLKAISSTKQCEKIKERLEGKTFMKFHIEYGGVAGNNAIIVTGNAESSDELREMFIHCALTSL